MCAEANKYAAIRTRERRRAIFLATGWARHGQGGPGGAGQAGQGRHYSETRIYDNMGRTGVGAAGGNPPCRGVAWLRSIALRGYITLCVARSAPARLGSARLARHPPTPCRSAARLGWPGKRRQTPPRAAGAPDARERVIES